MAIQSVQLQQVAVMFYSGDYRGESPPIIIAGLKKGDCALDTSCSILWEYTGTRWVRKAFINGGKIYLAGGESLQEMIMSILTSMPAWMECYIGSDSRVPRDMQLSKNDLVIHHRMSEPPIITATYYDSAEKQWFNINPPPGAIVTSADGGWSMWIGYFNRVNPYKSIISLWDIGSQNSADISTEGGFTPEGGGGTGGTISPADRLSGDTVNTLNTLAAKLAVDGNGNVVIKDGNNKYTVKAERYQLLTAASLDSKGRLYLPYVPDHIISSSGDVFYMRSEFDYSVSKYVIDFTGVDIVGVWKIFY